MTLTEIPHLRAIKNSSQLIVKGRPFLMLPAELHNSSLSCAEHMSPIWQNLKNMNFNTVLGSVSWEMIEPVEGAFDFSVVDKAIHAARLHGMHLILLWFGSYKNATSSYVPPWVKKDALRFPRVLVQDDNRRLKVIDTLSPFGEESWRADATAFAALMRHIKEIDSAYSTVLMVQVENESGVLCDSRDRSETATREFEQPIPPGLVSYLKSKEKLHPETKKRWPEIEKTLALGETMTWEQLFGCGVPAEEMFMAYGFSKYIEQVAAAGKKEYPLPIYTNVWLNCDDASTVDFGGIPKQTGLPVLVGGGSKPGIYPSGGPCPHTLDIWKHQAPSLDFISPDVYLHNYQWVCEQYRHEGQPLFIPEQRADAYGARRAWLAYGSYGGIGCAPFGIDTIDAKESSYTKPYGILRSLSQHILAAQAERPDETFGFYFDDREDNSLETNTIWSRTLGGFNLVVSRSFVFGRQGPGYGIIIHQGESRFLLIGAGYEVAFTSTEPTAKFTGILTFQEKKVEADGSLSNGRMLNGDERRGGGFAIMPSDDPDYGGFPIRVTVPAKTYVAECTVYYV